MFHKPHTGKASIGYEDSVEEAICLGWVDSLIRRLDDDRYARKFMPRKSNSFWSDLNRKRYAKVDALGLLASAGRECAPTEANRYPRRPKRTSAVPAYIENALKADRARGRRSSTSRRASESYTLHRGLRTSAAGTSIRTHPSVPWKFHAI